MKRKLKWLAVFGGTALLLGALTQVHAEDNPVKLDVYFMPMHFEFDGKEMAPPEDQRSFIYHDTAYVPLRFVSYALNKSVSWDADSYTVTVADPDDARDRASIDDYNLNRIVRNPERKPVEAGSYSSTSVEVYMSQVQYIFDGTMKQPDADKPGLIFQDSLYVPIRFLSESVGKEISFDPETYTVAATVKQTAPDTTGNPKPSAPSATATPAPSAKPATGGSGGMAPGTGTGAKPTYDSLIQSAESQISALQSSAESAFTSLVNRYKAAATAEEKASLISEGLSALASFDSQFESIMSSLSNKLTSNGYSDSAVGSYRERYSELKSAKQQELLNSL